MKKESDYYEQIKSLFKDLFKQKGQPIHIEITSDGQPSNKIKEKIRDDRNIIFSFLREARPDITGFIEEQYLSKFFVIEIKNEELKLDHIYQTRKYIDLFDAYFGFLVSTREIPTEIKKVVSTNFRMLDTGHYRNFCLCQYDESQNTIVDWYKENPFHIDYLWK